MYCRSERLDVCQASRLRLNPAKTQVMWLGSSQLVSQIDIRDIPVLSTHVQPVESARPTRPLIFAGVKNLKILTRFFLDFLTFLAVVSNLNPFNST